MLITIKTIFAKNYFYKMEIYNEKVIQYKTELERLKKNYNLISFFRFLSLILFLFFGYYFYTTSEFIYSILSVISLISFGYFIKLHDKNKYLKKINEALIKINQEELSYVNRKTIPFENGFEFNNYNHLYCFDLDIFGNYSLFQNLNRTATFIGKKRLADQLLTLLPNEEILKNQESVKELDKKLDWRQNFFAISKITKDSKSVFETLLKWSRSEAKSFQKYYEIISIVSPLLLMGCVTGFLITKDQTYLSYVTTLFLFNLTIIRNFLKRIKAEINDAENIDKIINQYSLIVQKIENETFASEKLIELQQNLKFNNQSASQHLKELSKLFSQMDIFFNVMATILFNGLFLFHLHILKQLISWKKENASQLETWLEVIGEFEMLNSLANLSYNNSDYSYPELNDKFEISFDNLSHPLLNPKNRIGNTVNFQPKSFVILTGSNMSGKSTFLRSLGINMVLAGIGSSVCASKSTVHPMPILVSMRLSDSLADSESYFFAEIKRLKQIMESLEEKRSFVLLDEILRGTNSDDKRNGTIEVVKKMIQKNAIGAIATHDIEVCLTTNDYPNQLTNKCFEVEIVNNDLHFDYKLRDGICKNRSASFLMQKMGVI